MKVRRGFVSNSSSSSFVIALRELPVTVEELRVMMFSDSQVVKLHDEVTDEDYEYSTTGLAKTVFCDLSIAMKSPVDDATILALVMSNELSDERAWVEDPLDFLGDISYYRACTEHRKIILGIVEQFLEDNAGGQFWILSYCNSSDKYESLFEDGFMFNRLPHLKVLE